MVYQHISVQPLTPTIGAVVSGIDLGAPSAEAFAEIKRAWLEHLVDGRLKVRGAVSDAWAA